MAESITITEEDTGPTAPVAEDNPSERPEWLPEKFNSAEDMAKSYSELEKKMSAPNEEAAEGDTPQSEPVSFTKFANEYAEVGELTTESFTELEGMGYPKEMVETYIKGMQSSQTADANEVMATVGGKEGYEELTDWAKASLDVKELELYNNMVSGSTENAKMAVEWLSSKREAVEGNEPNLIQGKASAAPKDEFRSTAQVVAAMKDPRYGKDTAYTKDVEEKLGRSSVF
ncbi:hypothetical protein N9L46_02590 [Amylibacter sp.]|nr:hypothetical protein [Amylibacter sp.]MDB4411489.1 hypothetical protein [bacterium]